MNNKPHIPFVDFPNDSLHMDALWPLIAKASLGMGHYNGILTSLINPSVLLSPLQNDEAILSSRIEGTIASLSEVLEYEAGQKTNPEKHNDIKEIINYRMALQYGAENITHRDINMSLIKELHKILLTDVRGQDKTPGQVRTEQNLVGKHGDTIEIARFVPPAPEILSGALYNFEQFIARDFIDPLVQLAIIHAQFEILHPFMDGNGRLGRMLIPLFLFKINLINAPAFYLSAYFEKNDTEYRDRLLAITKDNDWQGWCVFFLQALIQQSQQNISRANTIRKLYEVMKKEFTDATHSPSVIGALDAFFIRPIINSNDFMNIAEIENRQTANAILRKFKNNELISLLQQGKGQRSALYCMDSLLMAADGKLDFDKLSKTNQRQKTLTQNN